jgi:poly-beta-hydroxyalkanoate depolymerase
MKIKLRETMLFKKTTNDAIRKEMGGLIINPNSEHFVSLRLRFCVSDIIYNHLNLYITLYTTTQEIAMCTGKIRDIVPAY